MTEKSFWINVEEEKFANDEILRELDEKFSPVTKLKPENEEKKWVAFLLEFLYVHSGILIKSLLSAKNKFCMQKFADFNMKTAFISNQF